MITIFWESTETRRGETGGDTVGVVLDSLVIDAVVSQAKNISAEITEHPVEEGSNIADHVRPQNRTETLECIVSNTPIRGTENGGGFSRVALSLPNTKRIVRGANRNERSEVEESSQNVTANTLQFSSEFDRLTEVIDRLEYLIDNGIRVDVIGLRLGDIEGYVITGINPISESKDDVRFSMDLREFRTSTLEEVEAPSPRVERARRRRDRGRQSGDSESEENRVRRSDARAFYNSQASRFGLPQLPTIGGS